MTEDIYANAVARYLRRVVLLVFLDYISILGSFFLGLWMRFDFQFDQIADKHLTGFLEFTLLWGVIALIVYAIFGLYQSIWRFISVDELLRIIGAYVVLGLGCGLFLAFHEGPRMPYAFYILGVVCVLLFVAYTVSEPFSDFFNRYVSSVPRAILAYLTGWIPFSLAEFLIILMPVISRPALLRS